MSVYEVANSLKYAHSLSLLSLRTLADTVIFFANIQILKFQFYYDIEFEFREYFYHIWLIQNQMKFH